MTAFIDEKNQGELAIWGSPLRFSSLKRLENIFVRGVRFRVLTTKVTKSKKLRIRNGIPDV